MYYNNIEPQEVNSESSHKLKKKLSNLAKKEKQLTARLNDDTKELFQNYVSAYIEFSTLSDSDSFISGFRLGAKFAYDTFVKDRRKQKNDIKEVYKTFNTVHTTKPVDIFDTKIPSEWEIDGKINEYNRE